MNRRIKEKHEKQCSTGKHGMRREWKELLKSLGVWSFCQSQQEIMRKGHRKTSSNPASRTAQMLVSKGQEGQ